MLTNNYNYTSSLNADGPQMLKILQNKCFSWLRVLMPIKKHRDTNSHNIKFPLLLPYNSPQLRHSPSHFKSLAKLIVALGYLVASLWPQFILN